MSKQIPRWLLIGALLILFLGLVHALPAQADGTTSVTVALTDSVGNPIDGAKVLYKGGPVSPGTWFEFGKTGDDGTGTGTVTKGLTSGYTYAFKVEYNMTHAEKSQYVGNDPVTVSFQTSKITVELKTCAGVGLSGGKVRYRGSISPGTWFTFGTTGSDGKVSKEMFPGNWWFDVEYQQTMDQKQQDVGANPLVTFTTTKVTLTYSGSIKYYGNPSSGTLFTFTKPSMEMLPGTIKFLFDSHRADITVSGCETKKTVVVLKLKDHNGSPLAGGTARGGYGSSYWTWHVPGSTDANGVLLDVRDGLATTMSYEMRYNNTTQVKTQDVSVNSTFDFQTILLTLRLETCGGVPLDGGNPRYGIGSTYTTWWFPGGVTGSSAPGETAAEFFPGTYSFEMQYKATADAKVSVDIPNANTKLTWKTTKVTLNYVGQISYGGATGDSTWFIKPSMELLPGTYKFHFRGDGRHDLTISGCEMGGNVVIVSLHNEGEPLNDLKYYLECSGVGKLYNDDLIFTNKTSLSCRARAGSIAGPWFTFNVANSLLTYEYATVHVTLYNGDVTLGDPHKVEVSGVGQFITSDTFHVPTGTDISYRLRRNGIAGPWLKRKFDAGYTDWQLEFATVHVTLFNGDVTLGDPHKVEVSGVGQFTTSDTFHVPPDTQISYRLRRGGIAGPWLKRQFNAGYEDWRLEFATVTFKFDLPPDVAALMSTEISGYGTVVHMGVAHLPPGINISIRARSGGWATGWFSVGPLQAGKGTVIWGATPEYIPPAP